MVLFEHRQFWLSLFVLSCAATFFSVRYIDKVYSLVNITISADRQQVLADAKKLAKELNWDIDGYHDVTSFKSEDDLQCFVELEAGGKDAFVAMFESGAYYPYHWHVRFFKEKEVVEMHAWFSPEGKRLGFAQKLSELSAGAALSKEQAAVLIENEIHAWCPYFGNYKLIEYDMQVRDTGRIDHDFTYERTDLVIGQGFYRFKAVVCGDVITKLEPTVKVPDNFMRRYKQMRSANNLLAAVGSFFFRLLYLLIFGLIGLIFFYRRNYLQARYCAIAAAVVAGGMLLRGLNEYPLWWASYNTVQASFTFIAMQLCQQIIGFVANFFIIFLTLVVAQAAGQYIYKHHVQFFSIFNRSVIGSLDVAQQIVFGYLMVPFMLAYMIAFSYVTETYFGWWSPASSLFDPNVIATCFPWLDSMPKALFAGFFEEVVCRALPFAMMAVLTKNSKQKSFWFVFICVVQALIFGACHANYPNQPFYARLIEIFLPALGFGWVYVRFGLLPGVITHFTYDAILMAMPIWVSHLWLSKIMVVALTGLPLWIVLALYAYRKQWHALSKQYFNAAIPEAQEITQSIKHRITGQDIPARHSRWVMMLGILGFFAWSITYKFSPDVQSLQISKAHAIQVARATIKNQFQADLDASWTPVAMVQDDCSSTQSRFIWQVYGKDIYNLSCGTYLSGVNWLISFVQFSGAVEERGEKYQVVVSTEHPGLHAHRQPVDSLNAHVMKALHKLPEHFAGADIDQEQALQIVYKFIEQEYLLQAQDLKLISVNSDKFDNRRDWTIIMQDTQVFDFQLQGQARIKVKVCGDKVCEFSRFIFVPEDWARDDQAKVMNINLVKTGFWFLLFLFIALGAFFGAKSLMQSNLAGRILRHKVLFIAGVSLLYTVNSFCVFIASFNTSEPFYDQLTRTWLNIASKLSYQMLFCSIFLTVGAVVFDRAKNLSMMHAGLVSVSSAWFILGVSALLSLLEPLLQPVCGNYAPIGHWLSTVAMAGGYVKTFYLILSAVIALFVVLHELQKRWPNRLWMQLACSIFFCLSLEALQPTVAMWWMLLHGIVIGCVIYLIYYLVLRFDMALLPLTFGAMMLGMMIPDILYPAYIGASSDGLIAMVICLAIILFFYDRACQE